MKRFLGLLNYEFKQNGTLHLFLCALIVVTVSFIPYVPHLLVGTNIKVSRLLLILILAIFIFFSSFFMFVSTLNNGKNQKEIWLHSPASIFSLVGAKWLYTFLAMFVMEACAFVGLFFVEDYVKATFVEYAVFAFAMTIVVTLAYFILSIFTLFFYAFQQQMSLYVKKLSTVFTTIAVILFLSIFPMIPDFSFLKIGKINISILNDYMPDLPENFFISMNDIYIIEELVTFVFFIGIFVVSCKWLERVLLK